MLGGLMADLPTMNNRVKLRLIGLTAGIGLMGLVIAFITVKTQRQAAALRTRLNQVDSESFRIAEQFAEFLRQLNNSLYNYGSQHDPAERDSFLKASDKLDLWIDEQKPKLKTQSEYALMLQIDAAYNDYRRAANELQTKLQALGQRSAMMDDYTGLRKESQRLSALGQALAKAHFESRGIVLAQANQTITMLRVLVLVSLSGLFAFGAALAIVVYCDMIAPMRTKLVESRALVERHEKLASLGMLAAGVAHEIRNPLTAIKAALFMQQKKVQPGTQEFTEAKVVEREILRMERIVNDFLLFARPADPQFATIPACTPLREVHTLLAPQLAGHDIALVLDDVPPLRIKADSAQIKQVLINLIQNAADAIGRSGVITLRARRDRKRYENADRNVVILEVVDNGKGIPPDVQKRLFDPFFTTKDAGTGLGLSIAAGLVQKHGGALQYQSQVDCGTTFGIILPEATE
jgi:signal transduction histidine kinase